MPIKATIDAEDPDSEIVIHASECGTSGEFTACSVDTTEWKANGSYCKPVDKNRPITCPECIHIIEQWINHFTTSQGYWYEN